MAAKKKTYKLQFDLKSLVKGKHKPKWEDSGTDPKTYTSKAKADASVKKIAEVSNLNYRVVTGINSNRPLR